MHTELTVLYMYAQHVHKKLNSAYPPNIEIINLYFCPKVPTSYPYGITVMITQEIKISRIRAPLALKYPTVYLNCRPLLLLASPKGCCTYKVKISGSLPC